MANYSQVFHDLGVAFMVVIVIIYMLIVGWFQNFKTPIVMMMAIPLSLVGIVLLGHWLFRSIFYRYFFHRNDCSCWCNGKETQCYLLILLKSG